MENSKEKTKVNTNVKLIDVIHTIEVIKWLYESIIEAAKELMPVVIEFLQGLF